MNLYDLTPWEDHGGILFKREDKFAPFGIGGINGSKCRQLIHLFSEYSKGCKRVVTGASVLSPQHSMTAAIASAFDIPSLHVVASPYPEKHINTRIAKAYGAEFDVIKVGYNPAIQRRVHELLEDDDFLVPYGITVPTSDHNRLRPFHEIGANQVRNIPEEVTTLIMPAGSCNSMVSVMLGLTLYPNNVENLVSIGIGPDRVDWVKDRLAALGIQKLPFDWNHNVSLHDSKFAAYTDAMPESYAGIDFHPTYEGKIIRWLKQKENLKPMPGVGFWIVGGQVNEQVMLDYIKENRHEAA